MTTDRWDVNSDALDAFMHDAAQRWADALALLADQEDR